MIPLKVYFCNAWMKSNTPIHTKNHTLRNHAIISVRDFLTDNHHLISHSDDTTLLSPRCSTILTLLE